MSSPLTPAQRSLSRRYIAYEVLTNLWFVGAVWLYFYRIFITDAQVGILDGVAFAVGLIAEIPSGALADRFGRDIMVKVGQALAGSGLLLQAFGESFLTFFVGQAILMIGVSFASGADEALFFDTLSFEKGSAHWRKLVMRGSQYALMGTLTATVVGGWLHTIDPRVPWILTGLAFLGSVVVVWPMREKVREEEGARQAQKLAHELQAYLASIREGFVHFTRSALWPYVPLILTVQGLFYTVGWGILRIILLDRFAFSPFWGAVTIAASGIITVAMLGMMHRHAEWIRERHMLSAISLSAAAGLLLSVADIGMWGYIVILVLYAGEYLLYPFMSEILNHHTDVAQRATMLSVASFLRTIPYVALAPIIGYLNTHNQLEYFLVFWALCIVGALWLYRTHVRGDMNLPLATKALAPEERVPDLTPAAQ